MKLAALLATAKGRTVVVLDESNGDEEAAAFANQLAGVFGKAGWQVKRGANVHVPPTIGVIIQHNIDDPAATLLAKSLESLAFRITDNVVVDPPGWFAVKVGQRPPA